MSAIHSLSRVHPLGRAEKDFNSLAEAKRKLSVGNPKRGGANVRGR